MNKEIKRRARPLGLTLIAQAINNNKDNIDEQTIGKTLSYLINNNIAIKGKKMNIETLAAYLNKPVYIIMRLYIQYTSKLSRVMLGNRNEVLGAVQFFALKNALEDKALLRSQTEILTQAQGGRYVPFLTPALNQALANNTAGNKNIMDLLKILTPSGPQIAIQQNLTSNGQPVGALKSLGINEALKIMEDEGITALSYDAERYKTLKPGIEAPEVRANHQQGTKNEIPLLANPLKEQKEKVNHKNRRSLEEEINEEEDNQI